MSKPLIGSLFSGYGGLDMAVEAVTGGEVAWVSDIDPGACKILAYHHPDVPNLGDITAVDWDSVEPVDIITGGFPCQDVSMAGRRKGMGPGTRSGLWSAMCLAVDRLRPSLMVAENVRGLLSADGHADVEPCPWCLGDTESEPPLRALGGVLGDLADIGYDAAWQGLTAASIGAPHGRYRVFIIAWPANTHGEQQQGIRALSRLGRGFDSRSDLRQLQTGSTTADPGTQQREGQSAVLNEWRPVGETYEPQPLGHPGPAADTYASRWDAPPKDPEPEQSGTVGDRAPVADAKGRAWGVRHGDDVWARSREVGHESTTGESVAALDPNSARRETRDGKPCTISPQLDSIDGGISWGQFEPAIRRWERLTRPAPAPTETGPKGGQRLSPRFVEWMMGLPAGHVNGVPGMTRNEQLKALGNGVVPQQAEAALRHLLSAVAA